MEKETTKRTVRTYDDKELKKILKISPEETIINVIEDINITFDEQGNINKLWEVITTEKA